MSSKNDKEYLISIKTEYKLLEQKYIKTREDLKKWETRVNLAKEKGNTNLQMEAEGRAEIVRNDIKYLTDQLMGLKTEVEKAVRALHESPQQLSIDPNKLLTDMNNLIGDSNNMELEKDINGINVDNELERLKKEMDSETRP
jgi:phage shock protein A